MSGPSQSRDRDFRDSLEERRRLRTAAIKDADTSDAQALAARIDRDIEGEARFDAGSRALYATDGSNYRQVPIGVVLPKSAADVAATVAACREFGAPVLARGGGTSLAGQCCNVAVVMDMSRYFNRILEVDTARKFARVEPGVVLDSLRKEAARHDLTFGPDPATHDHCTLGGMLGNNSCGVHSMLAQLRGGGARTADNTLEMSVLTYDGQQLRTGPTSAAQFSEKISRGGRLGGIYARLAALRDTYADEVRQRYPAIPRRVSGYNLDELLPEKGGNLARALVGSESTCVTILEAKLQLVDLPKHRTLLVLGYADIFSAGDHVADILPSQPIGLEAIDSKLVGYMRRRRLNAGDVDLLPEGSGWLLVEFDGESRDEARARAKQLMQRLLAAAEPPSMRLFEDSSQAQRIWNIRESGLGATAFIPDQPDTWPGWEDSAVRPDQVGAYLRELRQLLSRFGYDAALYGHIGQGCIHCRIPFDLTTARGIDRYRHFTDEAADLVLRFGGSLSGEHGDGQARGDLLPKMFGASLYGAFCEFKSIWDPDWKMNPGKLVHADQRDQNLRLGAGYEPARPPTHFAYPHDQHSFGRAMLRCVGVGKCRREEGGTMCPSYMATHEEMHSTRGRAHLLFEMLHGDVIRDGWRSDEVRTSLDLCLACKGCKGDCPVNVDIATYKAEFLSNYYKGRLRPAHMYLFGRIQTWARLASWAPRAANALLHAPVSGALVKYLMGIAPERRLPPIAAQTFRSWFRRRRPGASSRSRVLLWPDTFCNHFDPEVGKAATRVLEDAGFDVAIPRTNLCCGRPLYDCGWLEAARRRLRTILHELHDEIDAGTPVVMLEPSCCAVIRDELLEFFPEDPDANRLQQQTFTLAEFLLRHAPGYASQSLRHRSALVHLHCNHRAIMKTGDEERMLTQTGLRFDIPETGCCGMAGAFGYRKAVHHEVSLRCAERRLLPAVRAAGGETLIIADGYSCREQIAQLSGRRALHLAEVLAAAIQDRP